MQRWMISLARVDKNRIHIAFPKEVREKLVKTVWMWVARYILDRGYPPYVREIASGTNIPHASVRKYLKILHRRGYIEVTENKIRGIEVLRFPLEINHECTMYDSSTG